MSFLVTTTMDLPVVNSSGRVVASRTDEGLLYFLGICLLLALWWLLVIGTFFSLLFLGEKYTLINNWVIWRVDRKIYLFIEWPWPSPWKDGRDCSWLKTLQCQTSIRFNFLVIVIIRKVEGANPGRESEKNRLLALGRLDNFQPFFTQDFISWKFEVDIILLARAALNRAPTRSTHPA